MPINEFIYHNRHKYKYMYISTYKYTCNNTYK